MGRTRFQPTDPQRLLVKSLAACGFKQEEIAAQVGLRSAKTLRKHHRVELDRGRMEANAKVARTLFKMATSGTCPAATIFWLKCQAGWREGPEFGHAAASPPAFIVTLAKDTK